MFNDIVKTAKYICPPISIFKSNLIFPVYSILRENVVRFVNYVFELIYSLAENSELPNITDRISAP